MPKQSDLSWTRIVFFVFIHIAAIVGLLQTTPNVYALSLFALFFIGSGGLAFQICLHRYFAHRSFKTIKPVEYLFSWLVSINFQGGVARWVANHKIHHQKADRKGDLHGAIEISNTPQRKENTFLRHLRDKANNTNLPFFSFYLP